MLNIWLIMRKLPSMLGSHGYVGHEQCNAIIAAASINHDLYRVGLLIDVGRCPSRVAGNYWHVQQRGHGTLQPAARSGTVATLSKRPHGSPGDAAVMVN